MKSVIFTIVSLCIVLLGVFLRPVSAADQVINITASVPGCGDAIIQSGEDCDGVNLNSKTCQTQGFSGGTLSCHVSCLFNTSACSSASGSGGGGGGGGGDSTFGVVIIPNIGLPNFTPKPVFTFRKADINKDGVIDIVDLSILLYYYQKPTTAGSIHDFNGDGEVDLVDISILLFYWT